MGDNELESKNWMSQVIDSSIHTFVSYSVLSAERNVLLNTCSCKEVWYTLTCATPVILTETILPDLFLQCWVDFGILRIRGRANKADILVGVCYRPPSQDEEAD